MLLETGMQIVAHFVRYCRERVVFRKPILVDNRGRIDPERSTPEKWEAARPSAAARRCSTTACETQASFTMETRHVDPAGRRKRRFVCAGCAQRLPVELRPPETGDPQTASGIPWAKIQ